MDKTILKDYIDAVALIKETEKEIQRLEKKRRTIVTGNVKGSNPEFPYNPQYFKIAGSGFTYTEDAQLRYDKQVLQKRKENAEGIKRQVEQWMPTISMRMQRIIRSYFFERLSWGETADRLGGKATGESVRKEFERFLTKK